MIRSVLAAAAIAAAVPLAPTADAATCGPRAEVLALLAKDYSEKPAAIGLSSSGRILEVVIREDGASWTVLSTSPQGVSCVVDAGGDWVMKDFVRLGPEA